MTNKTAFLFDLNGTMVDDMDYHITAWHKLLNDLGASLSLDQMKLECYGKNAELLERIFPGRFNENEKDSIGLEKEKQYQLAFRPKLKLIDGLDKFLTDAAAEKIPMAIGSAAMRFNIDFVLDGLNIRKYVSAIISADDVVLSKPHPETFLKCAEALSVSPMDCIVFEDSPKGVESAANAGMKCVVITTMHEQHEFDQFKNIISFRKDYSGLRVEDLLEIG